MRLSKIATCSSLLVAAFCSIDTAQAQDAVRLEVIRRGVVGGAPPALIVHAQVHLTDLTVSLACGGASAQHSGSVEVAQAISLPLAALEGSHSCTGQLALALGDGSEAEMPLAFDIEVVPAVVLTASRDELDLDQGTLIVRGDRPLRSGWAQLDGDAGELVRTHSAVPTDGGLALTWAVPQEEVLRIEVVAEDADGFASRLELFPWSYAVPHEEVAFESGRSEVRDSEQAKLEAAWTQVQTVVARYGKVAPVNLYVAGYTDTVGSETSNQRLSEARARAIAEWFAQRGFAGGIHYQGLGEKGLAVPTPDEVDEAANRRADYIIAAQPPPVDARMPLARWVPLR